MEREKSEDLWSAAPAGAYKHIFGAHQRRCRASPRDPNGRGLTPLAAAPRRARANRPLRASQRPTHWALVLRLLPQLWVYGQDPEQGQQPFRTTAIVLCHHSAAQEPREGMERASFWRCARLLICISDADAAPQCSQLALRSPDVPAHWAIMTAAARRLVTTSAASNASVARVPAVPQSRRAPIRRTSCKPGRPKGPPTQTGRLPFSSTLGGRRARSSCDRIGRCRRPLVAVRRKMRGLRGPLAGVSRFRPGSAISSQAATVLGACGAAGMMKATACIFRWSHSARP